MQKCSLLGSLAESELNVLPFPIRLNCNLDSHTALSIYQNDKCSNSAVVLKMLLQVFLRYYQGAFLMQSKVVPKCLRFAHLSA